MAQKMAVPAAASHQPRGVASAAPNRNGRATTRFLTHCAGRAEAPSAVRVPPEPGPSAGVGSPEGLADIFVILREGSGFVSIRDIAAASFRLGPPSIAARSR